MPVSRNKSVLPRWKVKTDMGVTLAELADGVVDEEYEVEVYLGPVNTWQARVITGGNRHIEIETKRGKPKTWAVFENALRDMRLYARSPQSFTVTYRDMSFVLRK